MCENHVDPGYLFAIKPGVGRKLLSFLYLWDCQHLRDREGPISSPALSPGICFGSSEKVCFLPGGGWAFGEGQTHVDKQIWEEGLRGEGTA